MSAGKVPAEGLINADIELQVADRFPYLIPTTLEETFVDDVQLTTSSVALQKPSTTNRCIDVSISRTIENCHSDLYTEKELSTLADSSPFID